MQTTRFLAPALLALVTAAGGCVISGDGVADATIEVANDSNYIIDELYLTDVNSSSWGRNLLGGDGLFPDESIVIGVECGFYDALLVDESGVQCEVLDLDLCLNDALWVINNNTCSVFGAKKAPEAKDAGAPAETASK
ncbi:MAG: hypothetical protein ACKV2T_42515 [Kofleriaceae bacterium]